MSEWRSNIELCCQLWDSWEPDAIIADKETGVFADPSKVHEVDFKGKYFSSKGRSFCFHSPQGRPVFWQAGSSDRGRDFAAKHAEAIFAVHPTVDRMKQYSDDLNQRLSSKFNRKPGSVKLIYGLQCIVGESQAHAQEKYELIRSCIPLGVLWLGISGHFGPDFSKYDLDEYVQNIEIPGIQGLFESIIYAKGGEPITVKEAALYYAMGYGYASRCRHLPSDVADKIEYYADEGGADGFMLVLLSYTPGCFEEFVDLVIPELQRRGRFRTSYAGNTLRENLLQY